MNELPNNEVAILNAALDLPGAQRPAYLDQVCAGDAALRQQVEALLEAHAQAAGFLEVSPAGLGFQRPVRGDAPLTEKPGDRIGRYKLLQQIGEGGCGVVYLAEQEEPVRRRVALKVIKLGMDTKQVIARFEAERQALALMDHPNIAKIYDAGITDGPLPTSGQPLPGRRGEGQGAGSSNSQLSTLNPQLSPGRPYFVMELVRGVKITEFCDENQLSTADRLKLFIQVCQAIQHAHQKGVIHRDIKPSNILVTINEPGAPGVPKVIDFGIAKATQGRLTDQTLFTAFEQFIGTPAYMSPEQAVMTSLDIDTRSDIYSLGVLLYELLTGRTPFDTQELLAAGLDEMRRTICEVEPVKPSTRLTLELVAAPRQSAANSSGEAGGALPRRRYGQTQELIHALRGDLDWIVMKCLEKDRTRRYETANGLGADITRHLTNEPVVARPPSRLYEFQKTARRHKVGFAATGAVLVALAAGVAVSTWQAIRAKRAEQEQIRLRQIAESKEKKSEQVARFLRDMLNGVGPSAALGRDTTLLREILDKTAERVGKDLPNQPEVEAELRSTIAQVYYVLGQYERAEEMYAQAISIWKQLPEPEHLELANALDYLAMALLWQGRSAEAEPIEAEALAMFKRLLGDEHPDVAGALSAQAAILWGQGKAGEAITLEREALAMHRRRLGNDHLRVAQSLDNLAAMLATEGGLVEAENLARQGLALRATLAGSPSVPAAISLNNLGCILENKGELAEAESTLVAALAMRRKLYSNDNHFVAQTAANLARVLVRRDKLTEAETLAREYLAVCERLTPDDWRTFNYRSLLGRALLGLRKHAEAEPLLVSGYAGLKQRENRVPYHWKPRLKEALQSLVTLCEETNRPDQAREWKSKLAEFEKTKLPQP